MPTHDDVLALDATGQAEAVRNGDVTPVELVSAAIDEAHRRNPAINAIIHPRYEAALADAAAIDPLHGGPFAGVPTVMKDLGALQAGEPYHMGVRALKAVDHRGDHDSALYRRFRKAGFVAIGRTNTPEWGSTMTTEPLAYGPTRNPWNLDHSSGGSSGGSAAAVAAGIVAVASASDGGGSIRIPASECGLVGLKPTRGRVSFAPDEGESWAGASIAGALTRSVRDAAAVLDALAGYEVGDPYTAPPFERPLADEVGVPPGRLRIGVWSGAAMGGAVHDECIAAVDRAAALLEHAGHHVEASVPDAMYDEGFYERYISVIAANTLADLEALEALLGREAGEDDVEESNLRLASVGRKVSAASYIAAVAGNQRWSRQMLSWWQPHGFDLLVTPVIAAPPPPIGYLAGADGQRRVRQYLLFTAQFNVTGQPAISLPLHRTADGLPVGVQLVAAHAREDVLVRVAAQLEAAAPWPAIAPAW
ncbi:MAG TPA: amidase family protein [Ilumatobacteraceae bacterium]|nr:amidase family protein [Ilumatobacteraceae bacterium]